MGYQFFDARLKVVHFCIASFTSSSVGKLFPSMCRFKKPVQTRQAASLWRWLHVVLQNRAVGWFIFQLTSPLLLNSPRQFFPGLKKRFSLPNQLTNEFTNFALERRLNWHYSWNVSSHGRCSKVLPLNRSCCKKKISSYTTVLPISR